MLYAQEYGGVGGLFRLQPGSDPKQGEENAPDPKHLGGFPLFRHNGVWKGTAWTRQEIKPTASGSC